MVRGFCKPQILGVENCQRRHKDKGNRMIDHMKRECLGLKKGRMDYADYSWLHQQEKDYRDTAFLYCRMNCFEIGGVKK
jgi:hypothetical protein